MAKKNGKTGGLKSPLYSSGVNSAMGKAEGIPSVTPPNPMGYNTGGGKK